VWAWALEWNQNYRIIGFFGDEDAVRSLLDELPELPRQVIPTGAGTFVTVRKDVMLSEAEDRLFTTPQDFTPQP
jgi:hypothetical protein